MTGNIRRLGTFVGVVALAAAATLVRPAAASACSGGMAFDWAVAHTRGWIATATVMNAEYVPYGFYRVRLDHVEVVRGRPPQLRHVTVAMGAVCDQSPDAGERILLLDGVAIEPAYDKPVVYVIDGTDAIPAADVAHALGVLPPTDAASAGKAIAAGTRDATPWLLALWLLASCLAAAWLWRPRTDAGAREANPTHSPGTRRPTAAVVRWRTARDDQGRPLPP